MLVETNSGLYVILGIILRDYLGERSEVSDLDGRESLL